MFTQLYQRNLAGWDKQGGAAALDISFDPDRLELTIDGDLAGQSTGVRWPIPTRALEVDPRRLVEGTVGA